MPTNQWGFNEIQETETIGVTDPTMFQKIAGGPHRPVIAKISTSRQGNDTRDVVLIPTSDPNRCIIMDYKKRHLVRLAPLDHIKISMSVADAK